MQLCAAVWQGERDNVDHGGTDDELGSEKPQGFELVVDEDLVIGCTLRLSRVSVDRVLLSERESDRAIRRPVRRLEFFKHQSHPTPERGASAERRGLRDRRLHGRVLLGNELFLEPLLVRVLGAFGGTFRARTSGLPKMRLHDLVEEPSRRVESDIRDGDLFAVLIGLRARIVT